MDNHIAIVHEHPVAELQPFDSEGFDIFLIEHLLDSFFYCFYLGGTLSGADYKIISDGTQALQIENKYVFGLFIKRRPRCYESFISAF